VFDRAGERCVNAMLARVFAYANVGMLLAG
jgi:hypothetical protein